MPFTEVMHKYKEGELHSGSKHGPVVHNRKQAIAIMLSEKREAEHGKKEYKPHEKKESHDIKGMSPHPRVTTQDDCTSCVPYKPHGESVPK